MSNSNGNSVYIVCSGRQPFKANLMNIQASVYKNMTLKMGIHFQVPHKFVVPFDALENTIFKFRESNLSRNHRLSSRSLISNNTECYKVCLLQEE